MDERASYCLSYVVDVSWKYEMNVGEYNPFDLVKDNTKKKRVFLYILEMQEKGRNVLYQPRGNLGFAVYVQSVRLIQ